MFIRSLSSDRLSRTWVHANTEVPITDALRGSFVDIKCPHIYIYLQPGMKLYLLWMCFSLSFLQLLQSFLKNNWQGAVVRSLLSWMTELNFSVVAAVGDFILCFKKCSLLIKYIQIWSLLPSTKTLRLQNTESRCPPLINSLLSVFADPIRCMCLIFQTQTLIIHDALQLHVGSRHVQTQLRCRTWGWSTCLLMWLGVCSLLGRINPRATHAVA